MKIRIINSTLLLVALLGSQSVIAGGEKVAKSYSKEFQADQGTSVYIENRFGQVNVENWDDRKVSIVVDVKVVHPDRDKAQKIIDAIEVEISQTDNKISAITRLDDKFSKLWNTSISSMSTREFSIDYVVKMPKYLGLELVNKYGDVYINELTGKTKIELKYGDLRANRILDDSKEPMSSLSLGYGSASIEEVNWFRIEIKHSKLQVARARAVVTITKHSSVSIGQASSIVFESKHDTYKVGAVADLVGEAEFTSFKVDAISKKLDLTNKHGDVSINRVPKDFESLNFVGAYSDFNAGIDLNASYQLDAQVAYGGITYGSGRVSRIEGNTSTEAQGLVGADQSTKSKVFIRSKYGRVVLK
jgi:hypothetical protein